MDVEDKSESPRRMPSVVELNAPPTDAQLAEQYRQDMRLALEAVCKIMTAANRDKIDVAFQLAPNAFGEQTIATLKLSKVLLP